MSTLRVNTLQNSSGIEVYTAKAWVNFNGTGTVAIRASGNVSSITDNGVGDYTVNFTSAMPDTNSCVLATSNGGNTDGSTFARVYLNALPTTTSIRIQNQFPGVSNNDGTMICVAIFR